MAVKVRTGGVMEFVYPKDHQPMASEEDRANIAEGWELARKRKRLRRLLWRIIIILVVLGIAYYFVF